MDTAAPTAMRLASRRARPQHHLAEQSKVTHGTVPLLAYSGARVPGRAQGPPLLPPSFRNPAAVTNRIAPWWRRTLGTPVLRSHVSPPPPPNFPQTPR